MRPLMWFRADLRVRDNTALYHACKAADRGVVAIFTVCPDQWEEHDWAGVKVDFILRTLSDLSARLADLNIPLLIRDTPRFKGIPDLLEQVAREHECDAVYFNREYEVNESNRDQAVEVRCAEAGLGVRSFTDRVVFAPGQVLTQEDGVYNVYSPFKRRWWALFEEQGGSEGISREWPEPKAQEKIAGLSPDAIPPRVDGFESSVDPEKWPAGEEHARRRLGQFIARKLSAYKDERDFPTRDSTSRLSPHLTIGSISPRQCVNAAVEANDGRIAKGDKGAVTWCQEIIWREFYIHILAGYPRVSMNRPFKLATSAIEWSDNEDHFAAWKAGRTGVPIVDAAMRCLTQTGWMHNRLRMIVAMYLTKDLFLPWWWGERHFMRSLVDGDLASNNGGWQWSASTGTDAQPYFRIFNPWSQSKKFDADGTFIREWVPELRDADAAILHDPAKLHSARLFQLSDYPAPIVDHKEARQRALNAFQALS